MSYAVGLIRVLTTDDEEVLSKHGNIIEENFPLEVTNRCIPDQPRGIHDDSSHEKAVPKVLNLAERLEKEGHEAIIISCAGDPALEKCSEKLNIPVIGAGRSLASVSLGISDKVGVLTLREGVPEGVKKVLGDSLIIDKEVEVDNTLGLMKDEGIKKVINAAKYIYQNGAEVITMACTGMGTIGAKSHIVSDMQDIKVVDPVIASGAVTLSVLAQ